jgi:hypothetical protein
MKITTGALELAKWVALIFMVADHVNRYIFDDKLPGVFEAGRIAFPLFGFVLAYNLARPGVNLRKLQDRLFWFGLATQPFFYMARRSYTQFDILLTFFVVVLLLDYWQTTKHSQVVKYLCAGFIFSIGGLLVDYSWFGILYVLASYALVKHNGNSEFLIWIATLGFGLGISNLNGFALAAAPLIILLPFANSRIPRTGRFFYWFYFGHIAALGIIVQAIK